MLPAHGSSAIWSLVIDTASSAQNMKGCRRCLHDTRHTHLSMVLCLLSPATASHSFQITVLTSAYPGHYPRPLLLEESYPFSHAVGTCSNDLERKERVSSFRSSIFRKSRLVESNMSPPEFETSCAAGAPLRMKTRFQKTVGEPLEHRAVIGNTAALLWHWWLQSRHEKHLLELCSLEPTGSPAVSNSGGLMLLSTNRKLSYCTATVRFIFW